MCDTAFCGNFPIRRKHLVEKSLIDQNLSQILFLAATADKAGNPLGKRRQLSGQTPSKATDKAGDSGSLRVCLPRGQRAQLRKGHFLSADEEIIAVRMRHEKQHITGAEL